MSWTSETPSTELCCSLLWSCCKSTKVGQAEILSPDSREVWSGSNAPKRSQYCMWLSVPWWSCRDLQEAAIRREAAILGPRRRSCSWTGVASWETPHETQAAMRVMRTWRMVMTAWVAPKHYSLRLRHPSLERRVFLSPSWCSGITGHKLQFPCSLKDSAIITFTSGTIFFPSILFFESYFLLVLHHWAVLQSLCVFSAF